MKHFNGYDVSFASRIFVIGSNANHILCDSQNGEYFFSSTKHRQINYYPSNDRQNEIVSICATTKNAFFQLRFKNGSQTIFASGDGLGFDFEPTQIQFPSSSSPSQIFCGNDFSIFCSSDFSECFGMGENSRCQFAGCENLSIITSPLSIFTGELFDFLSVSSTLKISKVFPFTSNTIILFQNQTNEVLFGTGKNGNGILSINSTSSPQDWIEMRISSLSFSSQERIKFIEVLKESTLYIISTDDRWFFSGTSIYSTCRSYFGDKTFSILTEIPQNNENCQSDNELLGQNVKDIKCSLSHCISLNNESEIYSWGMSSEFLGRDESSMLEPLLVNTSYCDIHNSRLEISEIYIQQEMSFVTAIDYSIGRTRVFVFGESAYIFEFEQSKYYMVEEFKDYNFTNFLSLSKGNFQSNTIFLQDTSICWGKYPNDSSVLCVNGYCSNMNNCSCDDGWSEDLDPLCSAYDCYGLSPSFHDVCHSNGDCIGPNECNCTVTEGVDEECKIPVCQGIPANDSRVCSENGNCYFTDTNSYTTACNCTFEQEGVSSENCSIPICWNIMANDDRVCSGSGTCIGPNNCKCFAGSGPTPQCGFFNCFDIEGNDHKVCSGNGNCIGNDDCECDNNHFGIQCSRSTLASIFSISIPSVTFLALLICFFCICIFCFLLICVLFILVPIVSCLMRNRKKMKKFNGIKNVDLIIEQQQLEERMDIAHLDINKDIFNLDINDIILLEIIGRGGSHSCVYRAKFKGEIYAFKMLTTPPALFDSRRVFAEFEREVSVLGSFRHKNILGFYGACIQAPRIGILMELCLNGDLKHFLEKQKREHGGCPYPMYEKMRMIKEIASAINHLHLSSVIHRDIKLENVLVDDHEVTKLMDFGLSRRVEEDGNSSLTRAVGTSVYMSPELIRGESYDQSVDVFAFGILCWIVFTEKWNCYGENEEGIEFKVAQDPFFRPKLKEIKEVSFIKKLIKICWSHQPKERPSFQQILSFLDKKQDEKIVVYFLFCEEGESFNDLNEDEAEDYLLKEKTIEEVKEIIELQQEERGKEKKEDVDTEYSIFIKIRNNSDEKGEFKEIQTQNDLLTYLYEHCLFVVKKKKKENEMLLTMEEMKKQIEKQNREIEKLRKENEMQKRNLEKKE